MNKNTKIWLNYSLGAIISTLLLWGIYVQVHKQLRHIDPHMLWQTGSVCYLWLCILLLPVNVGLEARKWHILAGSAEPLSYSRALASYLAGIAFSIVTPNRIGEYPGRILYLKRQNTVRLISVSVLGSIAQLLTLFLFGLLGLVYYNIAFPGTLEKMTLAAAFLVSIFIAVIYWRFENWVPLLKRFKWFRKYNVYGQLLKRFKKREQLNILLLSILRYAVFTAQYLFLLRWMNVDMPLSEGFCMATLFFWAMAIIPSIALTELGERGQIGLYLFHHFSSNTVGILGATIGIWLLNLIIPAIIGCILLLRMRLFR